jgi:hypothetical protein
MMDEKLTADLLLDTMAWMTVNVMEHYNVAKPNERDDIARSVIASIGQHNEKWGRIVSI